jgi:hypothetical protein
MKKQPRIRKSLEKKEPIRSTPEEKSTNSVKNALNKLNLIALSKGEEVDDSVENMTPAEARSLIALLQIAGITSRASDTPLDDFEELMSYADIMYSFYDRGYCITTALHSNSEFQLDINKAVALTSKYLRNMYIEKHRLLQAAAEEPTTEKATISTSNIPWTSVSANTAESSQPF